MIRQNPFGLLLTQANNTMEGSHLPFILHTPKGVPGILATHMARANRQWRDLKDNSRVLAVISGPHAYVSLAWYPSPLSSVPTKPYTFMVEPGFWTKTNFTCIYAN